MARHCYVSQVVPHPDVEGLNGAMNFGTGNEAKARAEAAVLSEAGPRFLLIFDDGVLVEETAGTPEMCRASCTRRETQRRELEAQADAAAGA